MTGLWSRTKPLHAILLAVAILHLIGITWGLPGSDGWDNDGIAPRDFLPGLVATFTPGDYFTYPPVHLALLTVLTLPITIVALVRAPSLAPHDVVQEFLKVPYMTGFSLVARAVSLGMSLGIVYAVAKAAEELRGRRAGLFVAAVVGVSAPFTYYAHTTNLDVPYLFWASLAILELVRGIARGEPRRLRRVALFAALAIGSKDQAYAVFLVSAPLALGLWAATDRQAREKGLLRESMWAAAIGLGLLLLEDGAVANPSGFRARLKFLLGSASQDFAQYSKDLAGRIAVISDTCAQFAAHYPVVFALPLAVGLWVAVRRLSGPKRIAALVPLLAAISFTLAFNCTARRVEERFTLPQAIMLGVYVGFGLDWLLERAAALGPLRPWRACALGAFGALTAGAFAWGVYRCANVDATLVLDARYDVEAFLAREASPGDSVEVYGLNVYLPRFRPDLRVTRVGPDPTARRNPMPGIEEVEDAYGHVEARRPKWIVVGRCFAWRYLRRELSNAGGRVVPVTQVESATDRDATAFFQGLEDERLGYHRVLDARMHSRFFQLVELHASLGCPTWVFERTAW